MPPQVGLRHLLYKVLISVAALYRSSQALRMTKRILCGPVCSGDGKGAGLTEAPLAPGHVWSCSVNEAILAQQSLLLHGLWVRQRERPDLGSVFAAL